MISRILAFRPANVVARLDPRSEACALSTRDLLGPAAELGLVLPVVRAPIAAVARGALVAAKEARSAIGLALPPGMPAAPWFSGEIAAGLPIFLSAEVAVAGEGGLEVERAVEEAWHLVDAGITHLAVDVAGVAPGERGRVAGRVAEAAAESGACVDVVVSLAEGVAGVGRAAIMIDDLARQGGAVDVASLRCPAPADERDARRQAELLARVAQAIGGVPLMRRGPITPAIVALLRGSQVRACEDGGAVGARAMALVPGGAPGAEGAGSRESQLERAVAGLSLDARARLESRAYVDALDLIEALGASDGATSLSRALERRLEDRR